MLHFLFEAEIISAKFTDDAEINVDHETYEILAADYDSALILLREQVNYRDEFQFQALGHFQYVGCFEEHDY
ncbi:MAG: hypothetical protein ACK518_00835 [bacterium]|jgi:hypothetical protein